MSKLSPFFQLVAKAVDVKPEIHLALISQFVRAGGSVTLTEWISLTGEDRMALAEQRDAYVADIIATLLDVDAPESDDVADQLADQMADAAAGSISE